MNAHARLTLASATAGILLLIGGFLVDNGMGWFQAHGVVLMAGTLLPALAAWHNISLERFGGPVPAQLVKMQVGAYGTGTVALGAGFLLQPSGVFSIVAMIGVLFLLVGAVWSLRIHFAAAPKESLVDVDADPLTKGDDASFKHLKMAHFFLPLGLVFLFLSMLPGLNSSEWGRGLWLAGIHVAIIGYGLLSVYGIGHLWVPRYSGVPAIAAGAIKGELHSTMPAMILLPLGFITGLTGFVIAGGAFAFLGFFVYMGVLGANIMRNKSVTHRVTPEFVYIPWTFAGIFWLVSGVLMGVFLTVVPDVLAERAGAFRGVHAHINLFGGILQLLIGWLTRHLPGDARPPAFQGTMKGAFYGFNLAVAIAVGNMLGGAETVWYLVAAGILLASVAAFFAAMRGFMGPAAPADA